MKRVKTLLFIVLSVVLVIGALFYLQGRTNIFSSSKTSNNYLSFNPVEPGDEAVDGTNFVKFDAFFLDDKDEDGEAEGYRGTEIEVGKSDKLYFDIKVMGDKELRNAHIRFDNESVKVSGTIAKGSLVSSTVSSEDFEQINLKTINTGLSSFFYLNVTPYVEDNIRAYNSTNKVYLEGTLVDTVTGEEQNISKEVTFAVNAYGTEITSYVRKTKDTEVAPFSVVYNIEVHETANQMPIYVSHIHGKVYDLNGVKPSNVTIYTNSGKSVTTTYDPVTQTYSGTIVARENNFVLTDQAYTTKKDDERITNWHVAVEYPEREATSGSASITAVVYNLGVNNANHGMKQSEEKTALFSHDFFPMPESSNGYADDSNYQIGKSTGNSEEYFVDKTPIIQSYDSLGVKEAKFNEYWSLYSRLTQDHGGRALYQGTDTTVNNHNFTNLIKYNRVKHSLSSYIDKGGVFQVINAANGNIIAVLDKTNAGEWIDLPENVHKVNIISKEEEKNTPIYGTITFEREFDVDTIINTYSESALDSFKDIKSYFSSSQLYSDDLEGPAFAIPANSTFDVTTSWARISLDKSTYDRNIENTYIPIVATTTFSQSRVKTNGWERGILLYELPEEIIEIDDLVITTENEIISKEVLTNNGKNYIKLNVKNDEKDFKDIEMSFKAVIDPRSSDISNKISLYSMSLTPTVYDVPVEDILDVDGNGDLTEPVNYNYANLSITAPREVITGSIIKDYDAADTETVSPLIADVNPLRGSSDANMEVFVINNTDNQVKNLEFIGRVGFIGNKYIGTDIDMGTEYDTYMAGPIVVPNDLNGLATIYYSTNANPTSDINDSNNGWEENVSDYSTIKSYMIKIDDSYVLPVGSKISFVYPIELPETTTNLNKVSYYNHAVDFKYSTDSGDYSSTVSGAKLGIRLARKYDLTLNLYKAFSNVKLASGTYLLEDNYGDTKTISIGPNGTGTIDNLYVNREYTLKQISSGEENIIDSAVRTFKITNDSSDNLVLTYDGDYRSITFDNNTSSLDIDLENEVLYKLDLHDVDVDIDASLKNIKFNITGPNHESGTTVSTDSSGHAYIDKMVIGEVYQVQQNVTNGYVPVSDFELKILRDPTTHEIYVTTKKHPELEIIDCDDKFKFEKGELKQNKIVYDFTTERTQNSSAETIKCKVRVDLTDFTGSYSLNGFVTYKAKTQSSGLIVRAASGADVSTVNPVFSLSLPNNYSYFSTQNMMIYVSNAFVDNASTPITGGRSYDVEFTLNRNDIGTSSSNNVYISSPTYSPYIDNMFGIQSNSGDIISTTINSERTNVKVGLSDRVKQTLTNYELNNSSNPVLHVNVENKKLEKSTFEIHKIDSETGEALEGAQFKLTGPGIPNGYTYLVTDSNGVASYDLYRTYSGNVELIDGIGEENYPLVNLYELKEVSAPLGYSTDVRPIIFKLVHKVSDQGEISKKLLYGLSTNEFVRTEVDNNTFKGYFEDFPSVKITKQDKDTNVFLPNTYFAIERVDNEGNVVGPALDGNDAPVGDLVDISGNSRYVIKTDQNGEIKINLASGRYRLEEVIASDEKYDLTDQIYYFTVAETIPYKPEGGVLESVKALGSEYVGLGQKYSAVTNDGGYIVSTPISNNQINVKKYDSSNNLVWSQDYSTEYKNVHKYTYFDDPSRIETTESTYYAYTSGVDSGIYIDETSDAYYVIIENYFPIRVSKTDGTRLSPIHEALYITHFDRIADNSTYYYSSPITDYGESQHYEASAGQTEVNRYDSKTKKVDYSDNGGVMLLDAGYGSYYKFSSDGGETLIDHNNDTPLLLRLDNNGDVVDVIDFYNDYVDKLNEYIDDNNLDLDHFSYSNSDLSFNSYSHTSSVKLLSDNSILIYVGRTRGNVNNLFIKIDANDNVEFVKPLAFNRSVASSAYSTDSKSDGYIDDNGNLYIYAEGIHYFTPTSTSYYSSYSELYNVEAYDYSYPVESDYTNNYNNTGVILLYNANGELLHMTEPYRTRPTSYFDKTLDTRFFQILNNGSTSIYHIAPVEGGYVILTEYNNPCNNEDEEDLPLCFELDLHNGTTISLENAASSSYSAKKLILYKVNYDSTVEWLKIYSDVNTSSSSVREQTFDNIKNGILYDFHKPNSDTVTDPDTSDTFNVDGFTSNSNFAVYKYRISDEVEPESPPQYELNIYNELKKYNISATNGAGGKYLITNDDETLFDGVNPGNIEEVKHGSDSILTIKAIPDSGYTVKSVTVNGTSYPYKVNDDGTITINKLTNITSDKSINVDFELAESTVIVHHYLKDTTTQIASDELLTGLVDSHYETHPIIGGEYVLAKDANDEYIMPNNHEGEFTLEPTIVTYYYVNKPAILQANYLYEDSTDAIAPSIVETKHVGDEYETSAAIIPNYEVSSVDGDEKGVLRKSLTQVNYYYKQLTISHLHVHYLDKDTNEEIAEGYDEDITPGEDYTARALTNIPSGYSFDSDSGNTSGPANLENIDVYFYYKQEKSTITTKYIDKDTNEKIAEDDVNVVIRNTHYETHPLSNIPAGYSFDSVLGNTSGDALTENITVTYYYKYNSTEEKQTYKLTTKYINAATGDKISDDIVISVESGTNYETSPLKNILDGFVLREVPSNAKGVINDSDVTVIYYYISNKVTIITRYFDEKTNKSIAPDNVSYTTLGKEYKTTELTNVPEGYKLSKLPSNARGIASENEIVVIYYYVQTSNPTTNDGIVIFAFVFFISLIMLSITFVLKKKHSV